MIKDKGKRTWHPVYNNCSHSFRKLSLPERKSYIYNKCLEHVTEQEIYEANLEVWKKAEPVKRLVD